MEITDSQGRKTRIAYDLMNREIRRIERDGGVQRTIYDRNGQVVRLIRRSGRISFAKTKKDMVCRSLVE